MYGIRSVEMLRTLTFMGTLVLFAAVFETKLFYGRWVMDPPLILQGVFYVWHFGFWIVFAVGVASGGRINAFMQLAPANTISALAICVTGMAGLSIGIML